MRYEFLCICGLCFGCFDFAVVFDLGVVLRSVAPLNLGLCVSLRFV